MRSLSLFATAVSAAAAFGITIASPAGAAPSAPRPAPAGGEHCVVKVDAGGRTSCFGTFTEAIAHATGGRITNAPRDAASAVTDDGFNRRVDAIGQEKGRLAEMAGPYVLSIEFEHGNFRGESRTFSMDSVCSSGHSFSIGELSTDWGDRISSFHNYSNCESNHYENNEYTGAETGWLRDSALLSTTMNDKTSSIRWR